jgi:hypothetical protein
VLIAGAHVSAKRASRKQTYDTSPVDRDPPSISMLEARIWANEEFLVDPHPPSLI